MRAIEITPGSCALDNDAVEALFRLVTKDKNSIKLDKSVFDTFIRKNNRYYHTIEKRLDGIFATLEAYRAGFVDIEKRIKIIVNKET